jgi:hypothetical protein
MVVWMLAGPLLGVLTFVLGIPMALLLTVRQSRGAVLAVAGWFLAVRYGMVRGFGGPFGMPWVIGLPVAAVFGWMFAANFVRISAVAWRRAWASWVLVRSGMPPQEIC